ncbi:Rv3654c family TadE-like protein [Mycolicibacterium sp. S2-37]|uniref:Rv3654c family TadE-like protein n=1 Tax=Mycolicibacterium sp. S2-37 TaxID=2810297 RepID=UPI0027DA2C07|nr:Rv3654c family TadE-like protein [Mycolicibacterium sp. S2-37]
MSDDRGAATLAAVGVIVVLVAVTGGLAVVGSAVLARHRAQAAADLSALAAAGRLASGVENACAHAASVAAAMGVAVARCQLDGLDVVVTVDVPVGFGVWDLGPARAAARAGPV